MPGITKTVIDISLSLFCREAVRSLSRNKLRSALSAIGIAIGIAAVVCVVAKGVTPSNLKCNKVRFLVQFQIRKAAMMISVENLVKKYNGYTALDGLDISVEASDIFGFLGPNEAGNPHPDHVVFMIISFRRRKSIK